MNWAVCTTYNEAGNIAPLVNALRLDGFAVCVIDDGSHDGTAAIARGAGASIIETGGGLGIGPSLMQGWRFVLAEGATAVVQIDAGCSHDPNDATRLLSGLDGADMVIGSRFCRGATYDNTHGRRLRPTLSRAAALACNAVTGPCFSDWTSGYRGFRPETLEALLRHRYLSRMHAWQIETLAHANADGLTIVEVPITYRAGRSSFGWRAANEAINAWLHVTHHIGGHYGR
jgi:dolichol-phosphate mannosyltransferase